MPSDLTGKTIVITGATSGIGFGAAKVLARRGAWVIGVGRSAERAEAAKAAILDESPEARVDFLLADLSAQRQVRALGAAVGDLVRATGSGGLDVLVNNAGAVASWYTATEDGYELQFAVNHLAPFLLTHELLPLLRAAPAARILTVSSRSHRNMRINWGDVMYRRFYNTLLAYKQSKLANVLFTLELNRRLAGEAHIIAYAIDPGLVNTEIGLKGTTGIARWVWEMRRGGGQTLEEGASTVVFVAGDGSVEGSREGYWKDSRPIPPSRYAQRADEAARLWSLSARLCGLPEDW